MNPQDPSATGGDHERDADSGGSNNGGGSGGGLLAGLFRSSSSTSKTTMLSKSQSFMVRSPHEWDERDQKRRAAYDANDNKPTDSGYLTVLLRHHDYRTYVISHICMHIGDWFVRIANLIAIDRLASSSGGDTGEAISILVMARLIPHAGFVQVGGVLADRYDRRKLMIGLDLMAGIVVLFYPLALKYNSLPAFYIITAIRATISAMYYPITTGIIPLMVKNCPSDMKYAMTINSMIWSFTAILGGLIAGSVAATIGLENCYYVDFATFWISGFVMYMWTSGNYRVYKKRINDDYVEEALSHTSAALVSSEGEADRNKHKIIGGGSNNPVTKCCRGTYNNFHDLFYYIFTCGFGIMVMQRASGSLVWGMEDIINVEFGTLDDESDSAKRMGHLYSVMGCGCFLGPMLSNLFTNSHFPRTYQFACLIGLAFVTLGWLITGVVGKGNFAFILGGTFVRTMGSGTIWMNSNLALQTLSMPTFLGRVLAVDYMLTTLMEAASAGIAGIFSKTVGFDGQKLSMYGVIIGCVMFCIWSVLYYLKIGAANEKFNRPRSTDDNDNNTGSDATKKLTGEELMDRSTELSTVFV